MTTLARNPETTHFEAECQSMLKLFRQLLWDGDSRIGLGFHRTRFDGNNTVTVMKMLKVHADDLKDIDTGLIKEETAGKLYANMEDINSLSERIIDEYYLKLGNFMHICSQEASDEDWKSFAEDVVPRFKGCNFFHQLEFIIEPNYNYLD